jgi:23S rRNA pseudouridine1911/1915/1917 synthase
MKARTIKRRYLAVVEGLLPLDSGTVNAPLGRHPKHRKRVAIRPIGGREAVTHYRVLKRFGVRGSGLGAIAPSPQPSTPNAFACTLVELSLETGRTHQIRVHMASLGHPVVGDLTYGKRSAAFWSKAKVSRQLLHAYQLTFQHPATGQPLTLHAPIPADLQPWCDPAFLCNP